MGFLAGIPALGKVALGAVALGTAAKASSDIQQANAQAEQMRQQAEQTRIQANALRLDADANRQQADLVLAGADAADYNVLLLGRNAELTRLQGFENERRFRVQSKKQVGELTARIGASGISISGGSAQAVLEESAAAAELDALTIRHEHEIKAIGFENDAKLERMRAESQRKSALDILEHSDAIDRQADQIDAAANRIAAQAPRVKKAGVTQAVASAVTGLGVALGKY